MAMQKTGIAARVVEARQAKHWTRADLAAATGLSTTTVKRIELNQFTPRLATVRRLATALDVPLWWLLDDDNRVLPGTVIEEAIRGLLPTPLLIGEMALPEPLAVSAPAPQPQTPRRQKTETRRIARLMDRWSASPAGRQARDLIDGSQSVVLPTDTIIVAGRLREDLGDLASLGKSIAEHGLLHPITVDSGNVLVMGRRRLEAVRMLEQSEITVRQLAGTIDPLGRCWFELSENNDRYDYRQYESPKAIRRIAGATTRRAQSEALQ